MPRQIARFGWRPDTPDFRDQFFTLSRAEGMTGGVALPNKVDLRADMPPIYNQGHLGSCVGNAVAAAIEYERAQQRLPDFVPSRLFIYWNARDLENDTDVDGGAEVRDGIKGVATLGACPETDWPYIESQVLSKPAPYCYTDALKDLVSSYAKVTQTAVLMKTALLAKHPIIIGISAYESFESAAVESTGMVPMPLDTEQMIGGHCMLVAGYDDSTSMWIVRNSWGTDWGIDGYCMMPYAYLLNTNLASSFWTLNAIGPAT